ncbi:probable inactive histone-lysine N-methyltransferase SUVR2 isoform X1 [Jatropha curcas]|nr:probable inactive histone-lysine N-methyltransferase SUVR2 isoform X1 [Jatropha curcas]XP_012085239.1 probable inactive histone-lysine N-methyltransferase SUVR2 isoform X1 [Jatropha curcas]XP_012085240.1 probable inactive histone-lysine N-methyltransferase SUVR2 isoform X1 [Jatropha curcas]XP_012085241.1 probable inactive histone-lysine N-methyltransferase SUVR2 isoform X1 [Jatropha curcas]XP_020538974.1 probable inactive histone-lysine N-methyltransferase SUVR2 isoform X1 [Jatropha curcas]
MAPNPRVTKAFRAMKAIGITENKVKPVLKRLLKLYDKNWELIEEENYRVLADAIFDEDDSQVPEDKENANGENFGEEPEVHDEPERPLKRLRLRGQEGQPSSSLNNSSPGVGGPSLKKPKLENEEPLGKHSLPQSQDMRKSQPGPVSPQNHTRNMGKQPASPIHLGANASSNASSERTLPSDSQSPQVRHSYKGKEPLIPQVSPREKRPIMERPSHAVRFKDPVMDPGSVRLPKQKAPDSHALIIPKDEPFTDDFPPDNLPCYEAPIAVIRPDSSGKGDNVVRSVSTGKPDDQDPRASHFGAEEDRSDNIPVSSNETRTNSELAAVLEESPANLEIASSSLGEVKISLSCNSMIGRPNFHMPSQDELLKSMQEKCLRSYKILDPNFSVMQMLKDMCECFLDLATDSSHESQESLPNVSPTVSALKRSTACSALGLGGIGGSNCMPVKFSNGSVDIHGFYEMAAHQFPKQLQPFSEDTENNRGIELRDSESRSLVVVPQHEFTSEELRSLIDFNDITKGEELIEISWLNEINNDCPSSFYYITQNLVYQNALVKFTLAQIKVEDCCPTCIGDCLSSSTVCVCASETGDQFAYTSEGLIREDFLEDCISMTRDPPRQCLSYCKACPLERSKNDEILEPCKGHLKRKYIKECWSKCACHKRCGNRVVQRGIRCKLQVFFTPEGKGWGLRTLEKLPKGAFVCEFIGEILTNKELHERNTQRTRGNSGDRHTYPVILDAYWCLKGALKEEEALCLDASFYGNVARFINHRCLDANLIEIPVKMETPDHHYYHLAFFTTREVNALEELTWDYGIDFDDNDHPVELFRCLCGSKFCRNMKRPSRSKSALR